MRFLNRVFLPSEFTGWHMAGVLVLFFGTIIAVNLTLAFNAGSTWTGLVVKNTYVESQKFNARSAELLEQTKLGWQTKLDYTNGNLTIDLRDAQGEALQGATISAIIGRPVHEGADHVVQFSPSEKGYFTVDTLARGEWRAQLTINSSDGALLEKTIRFNVKE